MWVAKLAARLFVFLLKVVTHFTVFAQLSLGKSCSLPDQPERLLPQHVLQLYIKKTAVLIHYEDALNTGGGGQQDLTLKP